jgi:GNAT superfamily N-acetyltransferase
MAEILTDFSTDALVRAITQSLYDFCWNLRGKWRQADYYENPKLRRWCTPIPMAFVFNAAVSLQAPEEDESGLIGETIAYFQSRERHKFDWWLAPGLEGGDWGRQLVAHGLKFEQGPPGMAVNLSALSENISVPAGVKISRVVDAAMMETWNRIFIQGYGLPPDWEPACLEMMLATLGTPMTSYLATLNDQPVATSSLLLYAGSAGIYNVATLPEWRGKGLGSALTLHPLREARQMGYQVGILQASDMGYKVYQRLGFKEVCRLYCYRWQAQADTAH